MRRPRSCRGSGQRYNKKIGHGPPMDRAQTERKFYLVLKLEYKEEYEKKVGGFSQYVEELKTKDTEGKLKQLRNENTEAPTQAMEDKAEIGPLTLPESEVEPESADEPRVPKAKGKAKPKGTPGVPRPKPKAKQEANSDDPKVQARNCWNQATTVCYFRPKIKNDSKSCCPSLCFQIRI